MKRPTPGPFAREASLGSNGGRISIRRSRPRAFGVEEAASLARRLVTLPPQDFNSNPVWIEDEECVVVLDVAIFLGREVNVRVACEASRVRGVDLIPLVDLEGKVLDSHGVVAVPTFVSRS